MITPLLRRYVLEPAWSRYAGATVVETTRELEHSQYLSAEEHRARQWSAFSDLFEFTYRHNAFYRSRFDEAGCPPASMVSWEDFRRLPVLEKRDVRAHGARMLSDGFDTAHLIRAKTGGSTGKPIEVLFTEAVSQQRNASGRRNKHWAGWKVGEPVGAVWGNPVFPDSLKARVREWVLTPTIYLDTMRIDEEAVRAFGRAWSHAKPTMLFGHAHSLYVLAGLVRDLKIDEIRPKAILPTSMMLLAHERALIEQVFGARATDIYGCEEVGLIAGECEQHDGLHLNMEQLIVEVLRPDGSQAGPGETGMVVVTDLLNRAMPFIRYKMEDMAEVASQPCRCGRQMPTLRRIMGRTADFLKRVDGSRVAGISLIENTLTDIAGIEQMQIVQEDLKLISLRVVLGAEFTPANRKRLTDYFSATFPGASIVLTEVSEILPEPNGKYRFSICRLAD